MKSLFLTVTICLSLLLQSCSGNGFHLRKEVTLPSQYQRIQLENISYEEEFVKVFSAALEESGGQLLEQAPSSTTSPNTTKIKINNFREEKRVIAYTNERKAREYLLSLKFDYSITSSDAAKYRINLDRVFIYDSNFAFGKAEEEKQIRQDLYAEASRLILLRLQYSKK